MRATWSEPYLWVHLAGLAAVPIFLELCLLGLAASTAQLPARFVLFLVAVAGVLPIVWMQWQRPFNIFSLLLLAVKPSELNESQRQILRRFTAPIGKVAAILTAGVAVVLLWQLSQWVPLVSSAKVALVPAGALGGLLLAMGAFWLTNLFLQVPTSVLTVMLTPDILVRNAMPYPVEQIAQDFTLIGLPVKQILPRMTTDIAPATNIAPAPVDRAAAQPAPTRNRQDSWDEALSFEVDETTGSIEAVSVDDSAEAGIAEDFDQSTADLKDSVDSVASQIDLHQIETARPEIAAEIISTEADQTQSEQIDAELTEVAPDLVAPAVIEMHFAEIDQAETDQAETDQAETDQAETDQAETDQIETDSPEAEIDLAETEATVDPVTVDPVMVDPATESMAADIPVSNALAPVQPANPRLAVAVVSPNAADVVVTIVLAGSTHPSEALAAPVLVKSAPVTVTETVVTITPAHAD